MIAGRIRSPFGVVAHLKSLARSYGATTLRIEAVLANEKLYDVLVQRYGLRTIRGVDVIEVHL